MAARVAWAHASDRAERHARAIELLTALTDTSPGFELARLCATCGATDHGRPVDATGRFHVSIAHAEGLVVVAAVPRAEAACIGVDAESAPEEDGIDTPLSELAPLFAPGPVPSRRRWTEIEAVLKADGRGLQLDPASVRFIGTAASVPDRDDVFALSYPGAPEGYLITVATVALDPSLPAD